jgi:hypothetical protein
VFFGSSYLFETATSEPVILSRVPLILQARPSDPEKEIIVSVTLAIVSGTSGSGLLLQVHDYADVDHFGGLRRLAPLGNQRALTRQRQRRAGRLRRWTGDHCSKSDDARTVEAGGCHFMSIANIRGNLQQRASVAGYEGETRFHVPFRKRLCAKSVHKELVQVHAVRPIRRRRDPKRSLFCKVRDCN